MHERAGRVHKFVAVALVALSIIWSSVHLARAAPAVPAAPDEAKYVSQLQAIAPEAVPLFLQANDARNRGDEESALPLYQQVATLAPTFTTAARRIAMIKAQIGQTDGVLDTLRQAYATEPSTENQVALAFALVELDKARAPVTKTKRSR